MAARPRLARESRAPLCTNCDEPDMWRVVLLATTSGGAMSTPATTLRTEQKSSGARAMIALGFGTLVAIAVIVGIVALLDTTHSPTATVTHHSSVKSRVLGVSGTPGPGAATSSHSALTNVPVYSVGSEPAPAAAPAPPAINPAPLRQGHKTRPCLRPAPRAPPPRSRRRPSGISPTAQCRSEPRGSRGTLTRGPLCDPRCRSDAMGGQRPGATRTA